MQGGKGATGTVPKLVLSTSKYWPLPGYCCKLSLLKIAIQTDAGICAPGGVEVFDASSLNNLKVIWYLLVLVAEPGPRY